jgi:hypothetical protein
VVAYFPRNVQTLFRENTGRNPDILIPGSRSTGSEWEIVSHKQSPHRGLLHHLFKIDYNYLLLKRDVFACGQMINPGGV